MTTAPPRLSSGSKSIISSASRVRHSLAFPSSSSTRQATGMLARADTPVIQTPRGAGRVRPDSSPRETRVCRGSRRSRSSTNQSSGLISRIARCVTKRCSEDHESRSASSSGWRWASERGCRRRLSSEPVRRRSSSRRKRCKGDAGTGCATRGSRRGRSAVARGGRTAAMPRRRPAGRRSSRNATSPAPLRPRGSARRASPGTAAIPPDRRAAARPASPARRAPASGARSRCRSFGAAWRTRWPSPTSRRPPARLMAATITTTAVGDHRCAYARTPAVSPESATLSAIASESSTANESGLTRPTSAVPGTTQRKTITTGARTPAGACAATRTQASTAQPGARTCRRAVRRAPSSTVVPSAVTACASASSGSPARARRARRSRRAAGGRGPSRAGRA